ncbi:hypothetical protein [Roseivivax sp. THAF30]|uniref:hypothetical protein n=1 Tax=Roseivivax sp. THAF30 TaxID=2587852 RepID=UPI0012687951|nr:hypothetical protein [Roseivivax sp. THAF30]QFT62082.1 hypothetical protein FIU91_04000 [Roseivivax sp. THAF30]
MFDMAPIKSKAERKRERREREARKGRLGRDRFDHLAKELAGTIRLAFEAGATGSLFGLEGPLRQGIRSDLCLMGWRWDDADFMARELLGEAFRRARAVRPTWYEGQPEWTIRQGLLIERTRCVECGQHLPEGHRKFCDTVCLNSHHKRQTLLREGGEETAVRIATRSI